MIFLCCISYQDLLTQCRRPRSLTAESPVLTVWMHTCLSKMLTELASSKVLSSRRWKLWPIILCSYTPCSSSTDSYSVRLRLTLWFHCNLLSLKSIREAEVGWTPIAPTAWVSKVLAPSSRWWFFFLVLRIEPSALYVLRKLSAIELPPHSDH